MNDLVVRTLIIILTISCFIAILIIPFYALSEKKKEFILRLFSSIEPNIISEMS